MMYTGFREVCRFSAGTSPASLWRLRVVLAVVVSLVACRNDSPLGPGGVGPPAVQTDRDAYTAAFVRSTTWFDVYEFTIVATLTNHAQQTIYLDSCGGKSMFLVAALDGDHPDSAFNPAWICAESARLAIAPGVTLVDTLHLRGPTLVDGFTHEIIGAMEGRASIVYLAHFCPTDCQEFVPNDLVSSNAFTIALDEGPP